MGNVVLGNAKKESVRINTNGDVIDPRTKQIIQRQESEYVPPIQVETKTETVGVVGGGFGRTDTSIQQQIELAEKHLADLKLQKKAEIQRMKDELAKLEATE